MNALVVLFMFLQTTNASISGTVTDPARASVPAARVEAENIKTGVVLSTTSNEAGIYQFPAVQPRTYRLSAELAGFRKHVFNDVRVDVADRLTINFPLEITNVSSSVEVTENEAPLLIGTASVGGVLSGKKIQELPLPDRDALGLVLTQPGLLGDNFAGSRIGALNVTRDGINVMDQRINLGVNSVIFESVDVVDQVRVVTSPVDAELGRGSGQVEILTRSGTNQFHGSVFEQHRNTALNANNWFNNLYGIPRDALILNEFGGRLGGPIRRNHSFFHFSYEGWRERTASVVNATTYTQDARRGTFRFFPGVENGNTNASIPTVDSFGNPVRPASATGDLQSINLFGRDPNRNGYDPSGTVQRMLGAMPLPNNFRIGDGLNTAGYQWRQRGINDLNQFNIRLDHNFSSTERLTFSLTRETQIDLNGFMPQNFPASPGGSITANGKFFSLGLSSTLSPNLENEFHAGAQRYRLRFNAPWELPGGRTLLPQATGQPYLPVFTLADTPIATDNDPQGRISPLYVWGDTLHWIKGKHTVKFGGELRFVSTNGFNSFDVMPRAFLGYGGAGVSGVDGTRIPGLGANELGAQLLLIDLSGSLEYAEQAFNSSPPPNLVYLPGEPKQRTWRQREWSAFFQDDFKIKPSITLNLGLRYEFYGVPWEANGRAAALAGGSASIFGISGRSWADLYQPGHMAGELTQIQLVGQHSPLPGKQLYADDFNNFGPAVGLSWSIPYFGTDKTVLRAGYSVAYERNALRLIDIVSGDEPGLNTEAFLDSNNYLDLSRFTLPVPLTDKPLETVPLTDRSQIARTFDDHLRTPYIQNWNFTIQRELPGKMILDLRYVGSKGTKLIRSVDINEVNIVENGLLDAFRATQQGSNSPLFDAMFRGFNLSLGRVNGTTVTGSASVRAFSNTRSFFADNDAGGFAAYLNSTADFTGVHGGLLSRAGLPDNWIVGNPQFSGAHDVGNFANSTYHSMQLNLNKRLSAGMDLQSNYTWSRTLGEDEGDSQDLHSDYRNARNRHFDKRLLNFHATHVFRNSGTWELPFGPDRRFLAGHHGIVKRLVEKWQLGTIFNVFSGDPIGLFTSTTAFNSLADTAVLVGNLSKSTGTVTRTNDGIVYFKSLKQVPDPAIQNLTPLQSLALSSTMKAITDSSGNVVLVNPSPGQLGNVSPSYLEGPGAFRFDVNLLKKIRFSEQKDVEFRVDAVNILNTPQFGNPETNIDSTDFGRITSASGSRIIAFQVRVSF